MREFQNLQIMIRPFQIICWQGETSTDLYYLVSGKLLIFTKSGTKLTALARITPGEFVGELSFFDSQPRASYIIALETSKIALIPQEELKNQKVPDWYMKQSLNLTKKIRLLDDVVNSSYLRKFDSQDEKPLSIEDQRRILHAINSQKSSD